MEISFDDPVIDSVLDSDHYKFTQGQLVFHRNPDEIVTYRLFLRNKGVRLADIIRPSDLELELDWFMGLKLKTEERIYLTGLKLSDGRPVFKKDYLDFLSSMTPPPYDIRMRDGNYEFSVTGPWSRVIYWEVPALAIFSELYFRAEMIKRTPFERRLIFAAGDLNLANKIWMLRANPKVAVSDFGTRRRASRLLQERTVITLSQEVKNNQFVGTSNVDLARRHGIKPVGTNAHESQMVYMGIYGSNSKEQIIWSLRKFLQDWWEEYGPDYSIALTDTLGSGFFLDEVFTKEMAEKWKGMRQDSGCPLRWGDQLVIPFYKSLGINPNEKIAVYADGLDEIEIPRIQRHFQGRLWSTFGWGTDLTHDLSNKQVGISTPKPLSLVMKATEVNGCPVIKLSDNPAKTIGDPEEITRIKSLIGYQDGQHQPVRY